MTKAAAALLGCSLLLSLPLFGASAEICMEPQATSEAAASPGLVQATWEPPSEGVLPLATAACDKTWCSERRAECREDCNIPPCFFSPMTSFQCFVLSCSYNCRCVCP